MDLTARITVTPDALVALARTAAGAGPDPAAVGAALAAGTGALGGLASAATLTELGRIWSRQAEDLQARWGALARDVARARGDYVDVETRLAS